MLKGSGIMREEDRKKCKNNKDGKESIYVSSSKTGLVFKLVIIALVFSSFLVVSVCFINKYNIDNILSINNYISYGDEEKHTTVLIQWEKDSGVYIFCRCLKHI